MNFCIIKAEPIHFDLIAKLEKECFSDPWEKKDIENAALNPSFSCFAAIPENKNANKNADKSADKNADGKADENADKSADKNADGKADENAGKNSDKNVCEIAGYGMMYSAADESEVINIASAVKYRRQGVAESIMKELIKTAKGQGAAVMYLEVRKSNTAALSLYEKLGFEIIGVRKKYYKKPAEDALIMSCAV